MPALPCQHMLYADWLKMSRPSSFASNARKREAPCAEWLVRVGRHFLFKPETLWLAEDLVQRYLAAQVWVEHLKCQNGRNTFGTHNLCLPYLNCRFWKQNDGNSSEEARITYLLSFRTPETPLKNNRICCCSSVFVIVSMICSKGLGKTNECEHSSTVLANAFTTVLRFRRNHGTTNDDKIKNRRLLLLYTGVFDLAFSLSGGDGE